MKLIPQDDILKKHIDHYWLVKENVLDLSTYQNKIYAYPSITPDMLIVLKGHYSFCYQNKYYTDNRSRVFAFIHEALTVDLTQLKSFILIKFKSRALSSLLPFTKHNAQTIISNSVGPTDEVFDHSILKLTKHLTNLDASKIVDELDQWLMKYYKKEREGFILDISKEITHTLDIQEILNKTNYSYSTLERHFKRDTGLTPKKYQTLQRCKLVTQEIYNTKNTDWSYYIDKYGYFDQSHFIKDIKRFTSFTPLQLLHTPGLLNLRPN